MKGVVSLGSLSLLLLTLLGFLGLESSSLLGLSLLLELGEKLSLLLGEWVELEHHGLVLKWVLLGLVMGLDGLSDLSELGLNLVRVDDSGKIGAGHNVSLEVISSLLDRLVSVASENGRKGLEGIGGENDESSKMSTWGKLENVKSMNITDINTWEISSGILDGLRLLGVDNEWSLSHDVSRVSVFANSGSDLLGLSDLVKVVTKTERGKGGEERLGSSTGHAVNNERKLWDRVNVMTSGHNEGSASRGSKSGGYSMSSLGDIDLSVPFSPDLEWGEHSTLSAHVTESGLSRS